MRGETMGEVWFSSLWKRKRSESGSERGVSRIIGVLTFEVASLMSKLVNVWQCLEDRQIKKLKEEIQNTVGIQKFISEDDNYLMDLAFLEIMENAGYVARTIVLLGKRCADPTYHYLKQVFDDPAEIDLNWCGWEYRLKKMERKVKKMERFVAATTQLYQELEVLAELEQSLRRMQANPDTSQVKLLEFQQKVLWQHQEVKNLREMSPWVRTYDYVVRLLLRSIFTIVERMKHLIQINQAGAVQAGYDSDMSDKSLVRSHSISALIHASKNNISESHSCHLERSFSNLGLSGNKSRSSYKKVHAHFQASLSLGKQQQLKTRRFAHVGPFKGCMTGSDSPVLESFVPPCSNVLRSDVVPYKYNKEMISVNVQPVSCLSMGTSGQFLFSFKNRLLNAPQSTLGYAALALHYANIIILIDKLVSSPHLISLDARDDLYNMLPSSIRSSLRAKLKMFTKSSVSSIYDAALAAEWRLALARMLEWLSPLAHNMIKWHTERSIEKQHMTSGTNVLLVQTLYFANQIKTEGAITELLMGLNYLSKFYKELSENTFVDSPCKRACDVYPFHEGSISQSMIDHTS